MKRKLLYGLIGGGVALLAAAILAVPLLAPTTSVRGEIERRVAQATGRAFRINGALTFSIFPNLGLDARDVTLANVPGGHARDLVRMERMRIAVKLWPLFSGRIEARQIVLEKPIIALEVAGDGRANWELVQAQTARSGLRLPPSTVFAGVTIEDGAVSYDNDKLDIHRAILGLDAGMWRSRRLEFAHRRHRSLRPACRPAPRLHRQDRDAEIAAGGARDERGDDRREGPDFPCTPAFPRPRLRRRHGQVGAAAR